MERIRLGRTDIEVPAVSVGTWGHSGPKTVGNRPVGWSGSDDDAASQALLQAFEAGIDHWDTADVYGDGRAEGLIGNLWSYHPARQDLSRFQGGLGSGQNTIISTIRSRFEVNWIARSACSLPITSISTIFITATSGRTIDTWTTPWR